MRITIQVTCEDAEDAKRVIAKLAAPDNTWVEQIDKPVSTARLDKIMPKVDVRPNISPGEPTIGKIGSGTAEFLLAEIRAKDRGPTELGTKYVEHLKLLWKRNLVKYDGEIYYLD